MELTGNIVDVKKNLITNNFELTVAVHEKQTLADGYKELKDAELLDIGLKKHRNKRSLDANAYFHVLVGKLAEKIGISKPRCKNIMIGRYGQPFFIDNDCLHEAVIKTNIPVNSMLESEMVHCMPCGSRMENGAEVIFYRVLRGSSTYDTKEMSILINGIVDECKEQGIETLTPQELKRMLSAWERKTKKKEHSNE